MEINGQNLDLRSSQSVQDAIDSQVNTSGGDLAKQYSSDNQQARGLLNSDSNFNNTLGYGSKAESDAIKARYMPQYNLQEKQLNLDVLKSAQSDHLRNLQVASQAASQEVQLNKQKLLLKWQVEQQNRKARGAILGTTLGIVGGVIGAYAGGAGGAAAGYQAGQGIGQASS